MKDMELLIECLEQDLSIHYVQEASTLSQTIMPYVSEIKYCYHTQYGPVKKGIPNLIVHKGKKNFRARAELLLFKGGELLLRKRDKPDQYGAMYQLPGGGIDVPGETIEHAAVKECKEEVRIIPKNVIYTGVECSKLYTKIPSWHKTILHPDGIYYDGFLSFICTGEYDKPYKGYVKRMDRDDAQAANSKFYPYEEVRDLLLPVHRKIADKYLKYKR